MNQLISGNALTMSSREISDLVNSRHDKVKQSIERLAARKDSNGDPAPVIALPPLGEYLDNLGRKATEYLVCKRDSFIVVAQLSPEFTAALVDRWQELESGRAPKLPQTFSEALRLAAEQAEQIEQQQILIEQQRPAVEFVDSYVHSTGLMGFRQVAKLLQANERKFRQLLLDRDICYYLGGVLTPKAPHIAAGRFEMKTGTNEHNDHAFTQLKFTPKGVEWVSEVWRASK